MGELSQLEPDIDSEHDALSMILEGTARVTGEAFFAALVKNLSKAMNTHSAWVTEYIEESQQLRALAFWADQQFLTNFMIDMDGTPFFAARASAELQRIRAEQDIRNREEKYRRIVETAREGFILLDRNYYVLPYAPPLCISQAIM
jgi:PAS domain-containing protein